MNTVRKKLSELSLTLGSEPIDIFLCSASFEDRCMSIIDNLGNVLVDRTIVAYDNNWKSLVEGNLGYMSESLVGRVGGSKHAVLEVDSSEPIRTADNIVKTVGDVITDKAQRLVIDATTFTRESLPDTRSFFKGGAWTA